MEQYKMTGYEEIKFYVTLRELARGGSLCEITHEVPKEDHIVCFQDTHYGAYRGKNFVLYHGEEIANEWRLPPRGSDEDYDRQGPTVGLLNDAKEVIFGV